MTLPPCKPNGIDCPRRYIGCRAECEEYHKWLAIHEAEKEQKFKAKGKIIDADKFLVDRKRRR